MTDACVLAEKQWLRRYILRAERRAPDGGVHALRGDGARAAMAHVCYALRVRLHRACDGGA